MQSVNWGSVLIRREAQTVERVNCGRAQPWSEGKLGKNVNLGSAQ